MDKNEWMRAQQTVRSSIRTLLDYGEHPVDIMEIMEAEMTIFLAQGGHSQGERRRIRKAVELLGSAINELDV